jgi:electron transport complex protein RnfC
MLQHTGNSALLCVKLGDAVTEGQIIGRADGDHSSHVHSSIPGRVISIDQSVSLWGERSTTVSIEVGGGFPFINSMVSDWRSKSIDSIREDIQSAGIVRLGGSPVPEHCRLPEKNDPEPECIIITAIETEPYQTCSSEILSAYPENIIEGTLILMKLTGAQKTVFAVDSSIPGKIVDVLEKSAHNLAADKNISIKRIPSIYPLGADVILAKLIARKTIKPGEQPKKYGILIETAATIIAIRNAVVEKKPLYEKFITVSGLGIASPGNYKVRIGTPISHIIEECGGITSEGIEILTGGPMRGCTVENIDAPVDKRVTALLFLRKEEIARKKSYPCIRCGRCIDVCPVNLNPIKLSAEKENKCTECISCAACSYVCPSGIDLSAKIKVQIADKIQK